MKILLRLFICIMVFYTTSCTTTTNIKAPAQCKQICLQKFNSCKSSCVNNCPACSVSSSNSTSTNYAKYIHERQIEGGFIARELNSYRDPLQCRKITCNCSADLSTCNQGCTGVIQKRLEAVPYCT